VIRDSREKFGAGGNETLLFGAAAKYHRP